MTEGVHCSCIKKIQIYVDLQTLPRKKTKSTLILHFIKKNTFGILFCKKYIKWTKKESLVSLTGQPTKIFLAKLSTIQTFDLQVIQGPVVTFKIKVLWNTAQKLRIFIKDFSGKCDQIRKKLRIWSHLLKKSLIDVCIT